ncbi:MAG TPA: hypothetical protein VFL51_08365 [Pseudolabrys sp.]|nr:hypothetical protein [Pseudolabrys sp.]
MPVSRSLRIAFLLAALAGAGHATAAEHPHRNCLTKAEQRAAVADHQAVPLAHAIRVIRAHRHHVEVVRARLCRTPKGLAYVLTLLARNGKVIRATVDAADGILMTGG